MPTLKQTKARDILVQDYAAGKVPSMASVMRRADYSVAAQRNPDCLTKSRGWRQLLAEIDDASIVENITSIALSNDKRSAIAAADMIFKLKDRYPASKNKIIPAMEERSNYVEE